jgi:hypothetical protein
MTRPSKHDPDPRFFSEGGLWKGDDHYMMRDGRRPEPVGLRDGTERGEVKGSRSNPHITHGDDPRAFSHYGSSTERLAARRDDHSTTRPNGTGRVELDAQGYHAMSEHLTAAAQEGADAIRSRTQKPTGRVRDAHDRAIASERNQYSE